MGKIKLCSLFIYYSVLLFAIIIMDNLEAPGIMLRIIYLFSFALPILMFFPQHFPAMLIAYMSVGTNHFAFTYFPYDMNYYPLLAALGIVFLKRSSVKSRPPQILLIFSVLILFVDIITNDRVESVFYSFLTLILLSVYLNYQSHNQKVFFVIMLCVMALAISFIYLTNYKDFLVIYSRVDSGVERGGWSDPNYLGCTVGMGVMAALVLLMNRATSNFFYRLLGILTVCISVIAMVLMASRGALLSLALGVFYLVFMSRTSKKNKIVVIACLIGFTLYLMNSSYVELLQYRLSTESNDGGNGRFWIWQFKLDAFFNSGTIFNFLFGYGYNGALYLGDRGYWAIHNDFVALLCDYGLVGLSLFLYMLYYPIKITNNENKVIVIALLLYLILCCCSLEPFSAGRLPFFGFYLFILCIAKSKSLNYKI